MLARLGWLSAALRSFAAMTLVISWSLAMAHPAWAQGNPNNNVQVQCNGQSHTFYLCQDGSSCGRIVTNGPAPYNTANSGQDNVDFTGLAVGESASVTYLLEREVVPSFEYTTGNSGNTQTFNDVQTNPARGSITDTANQTTNFAVAMSAPAGPFTILKDNSVASTRHSIALLHPSATPDDDTVPDPDFNFLKYTVTCTKIAPGTIRINKVNHPDSDPFTGTPEFGFAVDATAVATPLQIGGSVDVSVQANVAHSVTEPGLPANWTLSSATCSGGQSPDQVTVAPGATVTCTFTNKYVAPRGTIKIEKLRDPSSAAGFNDPFFKFKVDGVEVATQLKVGQSTSVSVIAGVEHSVAEFDLPTNWTLTSVNCGAGVDTASITVAEGETVSCVFTNKFTTNLGTIRIEKQKDPNSDAGADNPDFSFTLDGLDIGQALKVGEKVTVAATLNTAHAIVEHTLPANWTLTSAICSNGDSPSSVTPDPEQTVTCTFVNKFTSPKGTIKIQKIKDPASDPDADNPEFSFVVDGQPVATKLLVGGSTLVQVSAGPAHSVAEVALPANWSLTGATCDSGQSPGTVVVSSGGVVTCTFKNKFATPRDPRMEEETKRFIHRRVDNLLTHGPDRARMLRRLQEGDPPQSLKDGGSIKDAPMKFGGGIGQARGSQGLLGSGQQAFGLASVEQQLGSDEETRDITNPTGQATRNPFFDALAGQASRLGATQNAFKFGTSLSQLREMAALQEDAKHKAKLADSGLAFHDQSMSSPYLVPRTGFDVWIEGHVSRYKDDIGGVNRDGDFRILYVGADYVLAPGILIGALVQVDDTTEDIKNNPGVLGETGSIDGTGWMAGPYIGVRLNESLFFDARAAWGKSSNDIFLQDAVNGARHGSFDTTRWLASATLTGTERRGNWRFSPQVGIAYGHEEYDTYKNSLNQTINGGEASIGRITGGIEIGYQFRTQHGTTIEPHVSITGIYNFDTDDLVINGVQIQSDESRAKIEGGVTIMTPTGWGVRAAAHFDGIGGQDFESYGGSLWLNVPLN